ncbi:MAG: CPBP family intramembrane glutamic endopeptidase [Aestuariibacter sp.]
MKTLTYRRDRAVQSPAIWALLCTIPIPTLGVWLGMFIWPGMPAGETAFAVAKCWMVVFPLAWLFYQYRAINWPPINKQGLVAGLVSGLLMAAVIIAAYVILGKDSVDPEEIKSAMREVGLLDSHKYLLLAAYWTFVNSLLEEYFWRWFIVSRARSLMSQKTAILVSAIGFVAHHFLAMSLYFDITTSLLACIGILVAGVFWSGLHLRYRNLLPCYISHILADAAIFGIGYYLLFV